MLERKRWRRAVAKLEAAAAPGAAAGAHGGGRPAPTGQDFGRSDFHRMPSKEGIRLAKEAGRMLLAKEAGAGGPAADGGRPSPLPEHLLSLYYLEVLCEGRMGERAIIRSFPQAPSTTFGPSCESSTRGTTRRGRTGAAEPTLEPTLAPFHTLFFFRKRRMYLQ